MRRMGEKEKNIKKGTEDKVEGRWKMCLWRGKREKVMWLDCVSAGVEGDSWWQATASTSPTVSMCWPVVVVAIEEKKLRVHVCFLFVHWWYQWLNQ